MLNVPDHMKEAAHAHANCRPIAIKRVGGELRAQTAEAAAETKSKLSNTFAARSGSAGHIAREP
jgi:hypothetical protein